MKRWNGWGDDTVSYHLPPKAKGYLEERIGIAKPQNDASFEAVAARVPESRLASHPLFTDDPAERILHSRGQSLPDWVALRGGQIGPVPDGVAYPMSAEDVQILIRYASSNGIRLIPYGGGTSVVGHINPLVGEAPVLTVDMSRMNKLTKLDELSRLATFGAGVTGPDLEAQLRASGYTLGHYPQSFEYSTLGGWVATRSSGQQSMHYGRIEKLFAGGSVETPAGSMHLPSFPASAAGPDLREIVLGSEGRMGIITEAVVNISALPEREDFHAVFFPDFDRAMEAARQIVQARLPLSMLRVSSGIETETTLTLAGHELLIGMLERLLSVRNIGDNKSMMLFAYTGNERPGKATVKETINIARQYKGMHVGKMFGNQWRKSRFRTPYLRNVLWSLGYAVDTVETAVDWQRTPHMMANVENAIRKTMESVNERVHIFTHLSHLYAQGSSVYTTYVFRIASDPDETLDRWQKVKKAISEAIVATGGTISHQHGVGLDHVPYLEAEKGPMGIQTLRTVLRQFDPQGLMNPGKLLS